MNNSLLTAESEIFQKVATQLKKCRNYGDIAEAQYETSGTHKMTHIFARTIAAYFSYSTCNKIAKIERSDFPEIIGNSFIMKFFIGYWKMLLRRVESVRRSSYVLRGLRMVQPLVYSSDLNIIGIVTCAAMITNGALLLFLAKEIDTFGWTARGVFFFIGFVLLLCNTDRKNIFGSSAAIRFFEKYGKK